MFSLSEFEIQHHEWSKSKSTIIGGEILWTKAIYTSQTMHHLI